MGRINEGWDSLWMSVAFPNFIFSGVFMHNSATLNVPQVGIFWWEYVPLGKPWPVVVMEETYLLLLANTSPSSTCGDGKKFPGWAQGDFCDTWALWVLAPAVSRAGGQPWNFTNSFQVGFECFFEGCSRLHRKFHLLDLLLHPGKGTPTFLLTLAGRRAGFEAEKAVFPKPAITPFVAAHQHGLFWIKTIPVLGCSWLILFPSLCPLPNQRTPSLDGTGHGGPKMPQQCAVLCLPGALPCVCFLLSVLWRCKSSQ